jgi:hypothetical protein
MSVAPWNLFNFLIASLFLMWAIACFKALGCHSGSLH